MSAVRTAVQIPDTKLAKEATQILREQSTEIFFNHSARVYLFTAAQGRQAKLQFDPELLYVSAAFHDLGLVGKYASKTERFEVDGADAVRQFLVAHSVPEEQMRIAWQAVALHDMPYLTRKQHPEIALLGSGVDVDVLGEGFDRIPEALWEMIFTTYPRMSGKGGARGILGWLRTQARCDVGYIPSKCLRALYSWAQEEKLLSSNPGYISLAASDPQSVPLSVA